MNDLIKTGSTETMTSTQLAKMLGQRKVDIHKDIRRIFQDKIDEGIIPSSKDSRGYVTEYHLPELESKMFVAKKDITYLEKITKFWISQNKQPQLLTSSTIQLNNLEKAANLLERLGHLEDRDKLNLADAVRNTSFNLLPARTDAPEPITISGRAVEMGLRLDRSQLIQAGRLTAQNYKSTYNEEPVKHTQYVDGAPRKVNSYTEDHIEIIDDAIKQVTQVLEAANV